MARAQCEGERGRTLCMTTSLAEAQETTARLTGISEIDYEHRRPTAFAAKSYIRRCKATPRRVDDNVAEVGLPSGR